MFSFARGMETFPRSIAAFLGDRVRLSAPVHALERQSGGGFLVRYGNGATIEANVVICSTPAHAASAVIRPLDGVLADLLEKVYYPPVAEVFLGFREGSFRQPLDGFGYLIPEKEKRKILGTIWSSVLFPHRAPEGHIAFTSFVGGSRQPSEARRTEEELVSLVTGEINAIMGGSASPTYSRVVRWERAIPQYELGYHRVVDTARLFEAKNPGLYFCSNWLGGIAVGDCVMNGKKVAEKIVSGE